jgi:hypothetical protein
LKRFLFDLLELPSAIVELTFLPTEQRPRIPQERMGIFDIYCQDASGRRFIVEMQKPPSFTSEIELCTTVRFQSRSSRIGGIGTTS